MFPAPEAGGLPSSSIPMYCVEMSGIEPDQQRLQGALATSAPHPRGCGDQGNPAPGRRGWRPAGSAHAVEVSTVSDMRPHCSRAA